jgi:hypothetical protein
VPAGDERASVLRRVQTLLDEGLFQLPSGAEPRDPLPVRGSDGRIHSWTVPFVANGKLVAWAQIGRALQFLRFSLLAGGRIESSPHAADWLDSERVSARIADAAGTSDFLAPAVLTYDRDPSRLVWAAEVRTADGRSQRWFVAGTSVWRDSGGTDEVTGGSPRGT